MYYIYIQINISSIAVKLNRDQLFCHRSPFQIASLDTNGPCTSIDHRLQPDMDRTPRTPPGETHRTPCLVMIRYDESMRQPAFMPQKIHKICYITSLSQDKELQTTTDIQRERDLTWFDP